MGGALAGVACGGFYAAAREIAENGRFGGLASAPGGRILNTIFPADLGTGGGVRSITTA